MNSGALPRDTALVVLELKYLPSPRSPSLTIPCAVINTLAGFISEIEYKGSIILQQICVKIHVQQKYNNGITLQVLSILKAENIGLS